MIICHILELKISCYEKEGSTYPSSDHVATVVSHCFKTIHKPRLIYHLSLIKISMDHSLVISFTYVSIQRDDQSWTEALQGRCEEYERRSELYSNLFRQNLMNFLTSLIVLQ